MTPVASGRSVYETLILSPHRNIKGVKALKCQVYSYASRGAAPIHTNSAFVCTNTDSLFPLTKVPPTSTSFFRIVHLRLSARGTKWGIWHNFSRKCQRNHAKRM